MQHAVSRRTFVTTAATAVAGLGLGLARRATAAEAPAAPFKTKLYKALILNKPTEESLKKLKDAGYDGVEAGVLSEAEAEQCRAAAERVGMRIHSVLYGWAEFNSPDPARVQATFRKAEDALRAARAFGADAVLLVPCRIGGMKMPLPWEFLIEFDPQTGHLLSVAPGDNTPYLDYIKAHNHAMDASREHVQRLIPLAEKCGVVIALENVWNNLWVKPALFKHFVASFQSQWVRAYFDLGNHVKYAPPEDWILALGPLLARLHAKDFKLSLTDPAGGGTWENIREGSVRWPVVRHALEKVGYSGWLTIEGGKCSPEEHSRRLDLIIAGK